MNQTGIQDTVEAITESGGRAVGVEVNVTNKESVDHMIAKTLEEFGRIDILVNNAGISQKVTVQDMTLEDMTRVFNVNMFGLFLCTQAVLETMKKQQYGRIINLSSVSAKRGGGVFGGAHYSASKAAVLGFSKNLAREVGKDGITVNCVAPGLVNTDIWKSLSEEDAKKSLIISPWVARVKQKKLPPQLRFWLLKKQPTSQGKKLILMAVHIWTNGSMQSWYV